MKKNIFKICIISFLSAVILAISVVATTNLSIFVSDDGIAERKDLAMVSSVKLLSDEEIQVTYSVSRSVSDGFADIYKDENGNDFIYKNGKLTGYYSNEIKHPATDALPIGKEKATKIAVEWLSWFSDNVGDYELKCFEEKENYGQYYITFARKLGDIFTEEYAIVSVMYDGAVKSVASYNDGKYENTSPKIVEGISADKLRLYAQSEINLLYPDEGDNFDMTDYYLEQDENGYYISIYGNLNGMIECVRYDLEN